MSEQTEFPGFPKVPRLPDRGSRAWVVRESRRYTEFLRNEGGAVPPSIAGLILGISRQRVHQLMEQGKLGYDVFFERHFIGYNELVAFSKLDRDAAFRYAEITA